MFYFLFKTCYLYYPQCNLHSEWHHWRQFIRCSFLCSHNRPHTGIHCNLCSTSPHFILIDPSVCLLIQLSFQFLCFWAVAPVKIYLLVPCVSSLSSSETSFSLFFFFFFTSGSYQTIYALIHAFFALDIYQCSECFTSRTLLQPSPCISTSKCVKWHLFHQHSVVLLLLVCLKIWPFHFDIQFKQNFTGLTSGQRSERHD